MRWWLMDESHTNTKKIISRKGRWMKMKFCLLKGWKLIPIWKRKKKLVLLVAIWWGRRWKKIIINQNNGDNLKRTFWYQKNKKKLKRNIKKKLRQQVDLKRFFSPFSSPSLPLLLRVSLLFLCFLPYKSSLPLWFLLIFVIFFLLNCAPAQASQHQKEKKVKN